jgi:hypothetical protein
MGNYLRVMKAPKYSPEQALRYPRFPFGQIQQQLQPNHNEPSFHGTGEAMADNLPHAV